MSKLEKYTSYKDSGVEWLGEIPEHWEIKKLKFISKIKTGYTPDMTKSDNYSEDGIIWIKPDNLAEFVPITNSKEKVSLLGLKKQNLIPKDSILVNCIGTIGKFGIAGVELITNQQINAITFNACIVDSFGKYLIFASKDEHNKYSNGNVVQILNSTAQGTIQFAVPPKEEQTKIASFLDEKTSQIDKAISQKEKLIELLKEQKQITINESVTKGLDKDVEFKDSGVEWLGKVPSHWDVIKVKNIFNLIIDPAPKANNEELLSIYTDIGVKPRKELEEKGNKASTTDGYWRVKKGDFIVNKLLAWMGAIGLSEYEGVTSPAYDILRAKVPIAGRFYHELFRLKVFSQEMKKHSRGIMEMRLRLYFDKFGDILIPYASEEEQTKIVEYIETKISKIDKAIELQQNYILKLKEYKASLIDSVVTGKVRICDE